MKKLMIALGAVAMAIAANASAVNWTVSNARLPTIADPTKNYTGLVTTTADQATAMTISVFYGDEFLKSEDTSSYGSFMNKAMLTDAEGKALATKNGSDIVPLIIKATYTTSAGTYNYVGSTDVDFYNATHDVKPVTAAFNMNNIGTWSYTANAVPEPTSGLLLLLGVAGLALRRRRA